MRKPEEISKGKLKQKLAGYTPEPPEEVWSAISDRIRGGRSRQRTLVILAAAASIVLAVTVGIKLIQRDATTIMEDQTLTVTGSESLEELQQETFVKADSLTPRPEEMQDAVSSVPTQNEKKPRKNKLEELVRMELQEKMQVLQPDEHEAIAEYNPVVASVDSQEIVSLPDTGIFRAEVNEDSLLQLLHRDENIGESNEQETVPLRGKWQVGASLSPLLSYRDVAAANDAQNTSVNNSESAKMTYAGGVDIRYLASNRLSIESGIFYNRMGVNIGDYRSLLDKVDLAPETELAIDGAANVVNLSNSMGRITSSESALVLNTVDQEDTRNYYTEGSFDQMSIQNSTVDLFSQTFDYLEIPFNLRYRILDREVKVQVIGGLSTNILVANSISAVTAEDRIRVGTMEDVRRVNYTGNAGLGFAYELFSNFSLHIEPRFRYYLNSINASTLPSTRPYAFGLYTGVNYAF